MDFFFLCFFLVLLCVCAGRFVINVKKATNTSPHNPRTQLQNVKKLQRGSFTDRGGYICH